MNGLNTDRRVRSIEPHELFKSNDKDLRAKLKTELKVKKHS